MVRWLNAMIIYELCIDAICNVANYTDADIIDEHGCIILVNSRTCNTNNEIYYRYYYVVHVTYAYL